MPIRLHGIPKRAVISFGISEGIQTIDIAENINPKTAGTNARDAIGFCNWRFIIFLSWLLGLALDILKRAFVCQLMPLHLRGIV